MEEKNTQMWILTEAIISQIYESQEHDKRLEEMADKLTELLFLPERDNEIDKSLNLKLFALMKKRFLYIQKSNKKTEFESNWSSPFLSKLLKSLYLNAKTSYYK